MPKSDGAPHLPGTSPPTVWLVHDKGQMDFSGAKRFGERFETIWGTGHSPFNLRALAEHAEARFEQYGSREDWLLVCGNTVFNVVAAEVFGRKFGCLRLLVWHAERREYVPAELELAWLGNFNQ